MMDAVQFVAFHNADMHTFHTWVCRKYQKTSSNIEPLLKKGITRRIYKIIGKCRVQIYGMIAGNTKIVEHPKITGPLVT